MTSESPDDREVWTPDDEVSPFRAHLLAIVVGGIVLLAAVAALGVWASRADPADPVPVAESSAPAGLVAPQDQQFVGLLDRLGVPLPDAPALARGGREVCAHLDRGAKAPAEADAAAGAFAVTPEQGSEIVRVAVVAYCPQYRSAVGLPS